MVVSDHKALAGYGAELDFLLGDCLAKSTQHMTISVEQPAQRPR
jgi:hypothetical protein